MKSEHKRTVRAFTKEEALRAKVLLASQVAQMLGRKLEEGDWSKVYCAAKGIPESGWSNLHIDVNYKGLGVELKLLRCGNLSGKSIKSVCGTTLMHPAATRSIRITSTNAPATKVMREVFRQYKELIETRRESVRESFPEVEPDVRVGWLLWEDSLTEFLYFEQAMVAPDPTHYYAEWNTTLARGVRKSSKSLWIFDRETNEKRFSVTTSAGIKIQPYFDVPSPKDPNLFHFQVQGEIVGTDTVQIWLTPATAKALERLVGSLDKDKLSAAITEAATTAKARAQTYQKGGSDLVRPVQISIAAYGLLKASWVGVSDEQRAQLLVETLFENRK